MSDTARNICTPNLENAQQNGNDIQPSKLRVAGSSPAAPTKTKALTGAILAPDQSEPQLSDARCSRNEHQLHTWKPGDRVYSVPSPQLTGTVGMTGYRWVEVHWDNGQSCFVLRPSDLGWFTRPKEFSSDQAGQISGEVVPEV